MAYWSPEGMAYWTLWYIGFFFQTSDTGTGSNSSAVKIVQIVSKSAPASSIGAVDKINTIFDAFYYCFTTSSIYQMITFPWGQEHFNHSSLLPNLNT